MEPRADPREQKARRRRWLRPLVVVVISFVAARMIIGFIGGIDWGEVAAAFGRLHAWQVIPLLAALLARQYLNAWPLGRFVEGLGTGDSLRNDLAANLAGTVAPPPGDVVVRVAMFNSWGINPVDGMAGVTLNGLLFYSIRFITPIVGVALIGLERVNSSTLVTAVALAALSIGIVVALMLAMRGDRLAAVIGFSAGRVARRLRAEVEPQLWASAVVDFRARMATKLTQELPMAMAAMFLMVIADAAILGMALRFAGVGSSALPVWAILGAFLTAYPLTMLPLFGLGVMDAALIALWVEIAGSGYEAQIVAALVIWRAVTILGTLALGTAVTLRWRHQVARA